MQKLILMVVTLLGGATLAFGAAASTDAESKAHDVIKKRCTGCHGEDRINAAFKAGRDMKAIQRDMEHRCPDLVAEHGVVDAGDEKVITLRNHGKSSGDVVDLLMNPLIPGTVY